MQAMAKFMEQSDDFVVRKVRRFCYTINRCWLSEVTHKIGDGRLQSFCGQSASARIIHPCTTAFAVTGIQIEIEMTDQFAISFNPVELDVRVPSAGLVRFDVDRKEGLNHAKQTIDYLMFRKILFHFLL